MCYKSLLRLVCITFHLYLDQHQTIFMEIQNMFDLLHWNSSAYGLLDESNLVHHINWHFLVRGRSCMCKYAAGIDSDGLWGWKFMWCNLKLGSSMWEWEELLWSKRSRDALLWSWKIKWRSKENVLPFNLQLSKISEFLFSYLLYSIVLHLVLVMTADEPGSDIHRTPAQNVWLWLHLCRFSLTFSLIPGV